MAGSEGAGRGVRLEQVIRARLHQLPEAARRLLEVIAVAGRPLDREVARRAAGLENEEPFVGLLRANHLLRGSGSGEDEKIETYHDRIRETVAAGLSGPALAEIHQRLALALEGSRYTDAETLALHYQGAGVARTGGALRRGGGDEGLDRPRFRSCREALSACNRARGRRAWRIAETSRPAGRCARQRGSGRRGGCGIPRGGLRRGRRGNAGAATPRLRTASAERPRR